LTNSLRSPLMPFRPVATGHFHQNFNGLLKPRVRRPYRREP
jgi:hypothetical protein